MRLWQNMANLGALDYYLIGRLDTATDRSAFETVKRIFAFREKHDAVYRNLHSTASVMLRRKDRWVATEEEKGWIRVLTEAHIPFAEILPDAMRQADLTRYRVVILADEGKLERQEGDMIDKYVLQGGIVIASGLNRIREYSNGSGETEFLKSSGILKLEREDRQAMSAQLFLEKEEKQAFPSYQDIDAVPVGDTYFFLEHNKEAKTFLKFIPRQPFGPPECCCTREVWDYPGLIDYTYGSGRHLTLPWLPGSFYSKTGHSNTVGFMRDILTKHSGLVSVAADLTPMAEVTVSADDRGHILIQLVNNSGAFGLTFFAPLPVEHVSLQIPTEKLPVSVISLMGGHVTWRQENGILFLLLDCLAEYDALRIEFEDGGSAV